MSAKGGGFHRIYSLYTFSEYELIFLGSLKTSGKCIKTKLPKNVHIKNEIGNLEMKPNLVVKKGKKITFSMGSLPLLENQKSSIFIYFFVKKLQM